MIDLKEHNSYSDTIGCYSVPPPSYPLICHCPVRVHVRDHVQPVITTFTSFSNPTMGNITFYLYDHLGNTRVTYYQRSCGSTLTVENIIDYDPYGKVLREFSYNNDRERYVTTQHERDEETGYDYRGARFYDSDIARFLSVDSLSMKFPSWSVYSYVIGNPVAFIDPKGNAPEDWNRNIEANIFQKSDPRPISIALRRLGPWGLLLDGFKGLFSSAHVPPANMLFAPIHLEKVMTIDEVRTRRLTFQGEKAEKAYGSYTIIFSNDMKYHGKGAATRLMDSAIEKTLLYKVNVKSIVWTPSISERESHKADYKRMQTDATMDYPEGYKNPVNYNIKQSWGKRYIEQDGF